MWSEQLRWPQCLSAGSPFSRLALHVDLRDRGVTEREPEELRPEVADVVERVTAAAGDRQHAVALQRTVVRAAVRAPTPRSSQRHPLLGAEVVLNTLHPALSSAGGLSTAASTDNHAREPKQLARRSTRTIGNFAPSGSSAASERASPDTKG